MRLADMTGLMKGGPVKYILFNKSCAALATGYSSVIAASSVPLNTCEVFINSLFVLISVK